MVDKDTLSRDIEALSERIDARAREFRGKGEFVHLADKFEWFSERQRRLRGKLNVASNGTWDESKDDIAREHSALFDDFVRFERELDADALRDSPRDRAPGARSGLV